MNQSNTPQGEVQPEAGNKNIIFIIIALIGVVAIILMFTAGGKKVDAPTDEDDGVAQEEGSDALKKDTTETPPIQTTQIPLAVYFVRVVDGQEQFIRSTRTIPQTPGVARASLNLLLQGPTEEEVAQGLGTAIPAGTTLQDIRIENGVAYADFSKTLDEGVAGSAMVTAIREQITRTLMQFPSVTSVVISINGETEDILQP